MNKNIYISARDIAEDARLNYELDKWFWMPYRKGFALRGMTVLFLLACFPSPSYAEQCTATPDCKSLGYTETSCPDGGGVKCPWNTSLMYCPQCKQKDVCQSCYVGWILNSDMTCSENKVSGKTPIGVVVNQTITTVGAAIRCQGVAVALTDLSGTMMWNDANLKSSSYSASGVTGWRLPTKDELLDVYSKKSAVLAGLTAAGGTRFNSSYYWSSSYYGSNSYYAVHLNSGYTRNDGIGGNYYVRPVLGF